MHFSKATSIAPAKPGSIDPLSASFLVLKASFLEFYQFDYISSMLKNDINCIPLMGLAVYVVFISGLFILFSGCALTAGPDVQELITEGFGPGGHHNCDPL